MEFSEAKKMNKFLEEKFDLELNMTEKKTIAFSFMIFKELGYEKVSIGQVHMLINNIDGEGRELVAKVRDIHGLPEKQMKRNFQLISYFLDDYYDGLVKNKNVKTSYDCCENLRSAIDIFVAEHVEEFV